VAKEYDDELDDIQSILDDVCQELAAVSATFELRHGNEAILGTVETELEIVMEQMPTVLEQISQGGAGRFELYEQGVELCITLVPRGSEIEVVVDDLFHNRAAPRGSAMYCEARADVLEELFELITTFLAGAHAHCEAETSHPWFVAFEEALLDGMRALGGLAPVTESHLGRSSSRGTV
jgi:hypothetical protein